MWVRPNKQHCYKCGKNKPRSCRKFGRRDRRGEGRGDGKGDEGERRKPRGGGKPGGDNPKEKDEVSTAKAAYEECKRAFGGDEEHFAVKRHHAKWQELLSKSGGSKGNESKEVRELESQIKFLRGMDDDEAKKEREALEAKLAVAKAKTPYKSPSAELRAAEAKRASAAKARKKAQDETEAIAVAKQELVIRESKAIAAEAATQAALDEADVELEKTRKALASGTGVVLSESQAKAVGHQAQMAHTVIADAKAALDSTLKDLPPAGKAIFETLIGVLLGLGHSLPPDCKILSLTDEEALASDEEWSVAGPDGKKLKQKRRKTGE